MTSIVFEDNGFTLEQRQQGKKFKTFIYFDNVSNKIGYFNSISYSSLAFIIIYGIVVIISFIYKSYNIFSIVFLVGGVIYFIIDFLINLRRYKTLSLTNSKDIYFKKHEYKYINDILEKRNEYFYKNYFQNIGNYNDKVKIDTLNWLYKEEVVTESEILKLDYVKYNEEKNEFYIG
jgi:hypothetical protein